MSKRQLRRRAELFHAVQRLEPRQLLSYSVNLNSAVIMNTSLGEIAIELYNDGTEPATIANFLSYVQAGTYNGTIFHRTTYNGDSNSDTFGIVQGGGFSDTNGTIAPVATNAAITNEYTDTHPNVVGTIAMARTSGLNSATSQFFFNTTDNSSIFGDSNPYAAFGQIIAGLGIVDTIDNLNTSNSVTSSDGTTLNPPETNTGSYVTINTATEEDTLTATIGPGDAAGDRTVTFRDPATQSSTTISLSGANATLTFTGTNLSANRSDGNLLVTGTNLELQEVASTNTTSKSNLTFSSPGRNKHVNIGEVNITGSINNITGTGVNITGDIAVTGSVNKISLLASTAAGFISIDTDQIAKAPATYIDIPFLSDISIQSGGNLKEVITRSYTVDDGTSRSISASGTISKFLNYGVMEGSLDAGNLGSVEAGQTSGDIESSGTIGSIRLAEMQEGVIYAGAAYNAKTLAIKSIKVGAGISDTRIVSSGNIGPIITPSLTSSAVAAGIDTSSSSAGPDGFSYSLASKAYIKSITLKSPKTAKGVSFSDSQIQAYEIDNLNLGKFSTTLGSTFPSVMGVQAVDIKSLTANSDKHQSLHLTNTTSASALAAFLTKQKINLGATTVGTLASGTTTTSGLTSGYTYSTLTLNGPLVASITAGTSLNIVSGSNTQTVTLSAAAAAGATTISVTPFTANADYPASAIVQNIQTTATTTSVNSGSTYNAITLNGGLVIALAAGATVTLTASDNTTQTLTLASAAAVGATTLNVTTFTANDTYASGSTVQGTTVNGTTTTGITSGDTYGTITLNAASSEALSVGAVLTLVASDGTTQNVTVSAAATTSSTAINVDPFTATDTFASGAEVEDSSGNVIGTISTGTLTSTGTIASGTSLVQATLGTSTGNSTGLFSGVAYTAVNLNAAITSAIASGAPVVLSSGNNIQVLILSAAASAGDTSLSTNSFSPNANYPFGSTLKTGGFSIDIIPASDIGASTSSS